MTKQDLVAAVASSVGVSKKVAGEALEAVLSAITKSLKKVFQRESEEFLF